MLNWKQSQAAKMLKIKHSTAKMMIRNYKECDVQDLAD